MEVTCLDLKAQFYVEKYVSGSVGACILYNEQWLMPNKFHTAAGSRAKNYKQSIKCNGKPILKILQKMKQKLMKMILIGD